MQSLSIEVSERSLITLLVTCKETQKIQNSMESYITLPADVNFIGCINKGIDTSLPNTTIHILYPSYLM